ncbi:MAG: sigma-70 family RNA polymerase sigma factor [Actinobacteria bacterium]|nr:MAG: sigma-70 family RNA polymerase sigma factor [Actinomycetota bacterium]
MQTASDVDGGAIEFEDLYLDERIRLVRAMLLLTGRAGEAEDLAQEAFVRVYERWSHVREMESPTGYLYRTALNLHRKRLRRLAVELRKRAVRQDDDRGGDVGDERLDLLRAVAALPIAQRQAVVLVDWLGFPPSEAALLLGIEAASVRGRLHRARRELRRQDGGNDA